MKKTPVKPPLFRISQKVWESIDPLTIVDTTNAMMDMDLWRPPYMHFVVQTTALLGNEAWDKVWLKTEETHKNREFLKDKEWKIEYKCNLDEEFIIENGRAYEYDGVLILRNKGEVPFDFLMRKGGKNAQYIDHIVEFVFGGLIILLATKNADKETIINDPRSRTHRVREDFKKYSTTTTIKIGKITENIRSAGGNGKAMRPHLRRGHVRNQRFGEGKQEIKKIFIQPCFVNADKDWVDINKDYKVLA
jgi:DNA-dependent RNA polymerase auxiliary subunit epsilon